MLPLGLCHSGQFKFLIALNKNSFKNLVLCIYLYIFLILRSGVVLGREGGMIKQTILPFFFGLGGRIGSGDQVMPWIHVKVN